MIHFEGDRSLPVGPDGVAARLGDAGFIVRSLENVDQVVEAGPDKAVWKLRTGFSFLSTSLEVTLTVTDRSADRAAYEAFSRGVGSSSRVRAVLDFQPAVAGTTVHYTAELVER